MMTYHRGSFTALACLGALAMGCGGWVDLESPTPAGSGPVDAAAAGGATSAGSHQLGGQSGAGANASTLSGGQPTGEGGENAAPFFISLESPAPTLVPDAASAPDVSWTGTPSIDVGSLEDGALAGSNSYCFKSSQNSPSCAWNTAEPFVWTEEKGMVVLDRLNLPGARSFYPTHVSSDGRTVVGAFSRSSPNGPVFGGFFRWNDTEGGTSLGEPASVESGGPEHMSKDGQVVVGTAKLAKVGDIDHAEFLWTVARGYQTLDASSNWPEGGEIVALSDDGSVLVGETNTSPKQVFRWTVADGVEPLGDLPSLPDCRSYHVSGDASVVFGTCENYPNPPGAFRWTAAEGMTPLTKNGSAEPCEMYVMASSEDGSVAYGSARCGVETEAHFARWAQSTGVVALPGLAPQTPLIHFGTSRDGRVAFGAVSSGAGAGQIFASGPGFRFDSARGMADLEMLPGREFSAPNTSDAAGDFVAGLSGFINGESAAVLWGAQGVLDIAALLRARGAALHGARLASAERIVSRDSGLLVQGLSDVGTRSGAWFAWLPSPAP